MEQETITILRKNIATLMGLRGVTNINALSKSAKLDFKTVGNLMADDFISNPTIKIVHRLAKALRVEPWMMLVDEFPFEQIKGKPLKQIHGPAYIIADAMEHEPHTVQLLMMEAVSHSLRGIDIKRSHQIKDEQVAYLTGTRKGPQ